MPKVDIDTAYIENLAELLARTGLTEIEICQGDARIRVAKQVATSVEYVQAGHMVAPAAPAGSSWGMAETAGRVAMPPA